MPDINFQLSTDLKPLNNVMLSANFDECKTALTETMAVYRAMIVSEDGIAGAKSDRARINHMITNIDDARKAIKAQYIKPLQEFEGKCKELTDICAEARNNIDGQVKAFEQAAKDAKIERLHLYFMSNAGEDIKPYVDWDKAVNPKWGNATYAENKAMSEIDDLFIRYKSDLDAILHLGSEFETTLLANYKQTHDVSAAVRLDAELKRLKATEDEKKRLAEERKSAQPPAEEIDAVAPAPPTELKESIDTESLVVDFRVYCTKAQLARLKEFLLSNGIRYGKVKG